jgi:tetratricopeptide (TPR) repeat protein
MTRSTRTLLALAAAMSVAILTAPGRLAHAEGITRVRGTVVDNHGKALSGVPIYFEATDIKKTVGPLRTNKKGDYIIASLDITVARKWRVVPKQKGYMVVTIAYQIVDSRKQEVANQEQVIGSKQELPELHFALVGDDGRNVVNFVLARESEFVAAVEAAKKAKEGAGAVVSGGPASPGQAAVPVTAPAEGAASPAPAVPGPALSIPGGREMLEKAKQLADAGRQQEAIDLYRSFIIKDATGNPAVYYYLGKSLFTSGDNGAAEQAFKKGLELKPDMKGCHFYLGNIALKEEDPGVAAAEYEKELQLTPGSDAVLFNLGQAYAKAGKDDQALAAFGQAATISPAKSETYMQMAAIYDRRKEPEKANEMYQKVIALDPKNAAVSFYNIGVNAWNENRSNDAAQAFRKAVELDPTYAVTHRELARALMGLQDFQGALKHFQEYLKLNPNASDAKEIRDSIALLKK